MIKYLRLEEEYPEWAHKRERGWCERLRTAEGSSLVVTGKNGESLLDPGVRREKGMNEGEHSSRNRVVPRILRPEDRYFDLFFGAFSLPYKLPLTSPSVDLLGSHSAYTPHP